MIGWSQREGSRRPERRGEVIEAAYELMEDPSSLTDTTFWTFTTEYGDLDVVLRPAGFPQGYDDLSTAS